MTEDYALGLELKKEGYQCRYVRDYLALGKIFLPGLTPSCLLTIEEHQSPVYFNEFNESSRLNFLA